MASARQVVDRPRQAPSVYAPHTDADREGSGQFAIRRDDIAAEPEAGQMPPLLTGLLALFAAIAALGTALAALRVHAGAGVSLLDLVSVACLLLSSLALLARRRLGQVLVELSAPHADSPVGDSGADSIVGPRLVARPRLDTRQTPSLQAVTLHDDSEACFEPALSHCSKAERDTFITTLRDLPTVSEVHVARVRLVESGRVAERVLVVAVGSSIEAAEAHTALSLALAGVTDGRVLPVWFLRHGSARLAQLRAAGCLVLRRRALKRWPSAMNDTGARS